MFDQLSRALFGGQVMVTSYILKGEAGKRYVGITNDLSRRIKEHRSHKSKGGQLLADFRIVPERFLPQDSLY